MRDSRKNYVLVGTFLLLIITTLVVWLSVLSGGTGPSSPYYIEFENVMSLTEGGQVLYEGYPVGQIEDIELASRPEESFYRLDVSIREGWEIPEDSMAVVTQAGFLSAVVIDIEAGKSGQMLAPGDRIPSGRTTNMLTALSTAASKLGELADTSLKPLLDNLAEGTGSLQSLSQEVPAILENLKTFTVRLNETAERLNSLLDQSGGRVDTILADFEYASGNFASLTADVRQTEKRLDALLVSMNSLISKNRGEIDHSIADLHHTLEVVASHVQAISSNLEATTRNMNEFTAEIRRDPGMIIRGREFKEDLESGKK